MPVVFRHRGFRFHFFSNEGFPREPEHIHVQKGDADAKFWLYPTISVARNQGFSAKELAELLKQVEQRRDEIERAWNDHFG